MYLLNTQLVANQSQFYNVTPVLTFDRPLHWKALTIIQSQPNGTELNQTVLRLGGPGSTPRPPEHGQHISCP